MPGLAQREGKTNGPTYLVVMAPRDLGGAPARAAVGGQLARRRGRQRGAEGALLPPAGGDVGATSIHERSFVLPSAASSAAPTAKGVGAGDQDADSRHHGFLLASAKGVGAGDWKVSAAAARKVSNVGFFCFGDDDWF